MIGCGVRRLVPKGVLRSALVLVLCLGTVAGLTVQVGRTSCAAVVEATAWARPMAHQVKNTLLGVWRFASAHENVDALNATRQQALRLETDAMFLVARDVSTALALVLPLLGLLTGVAIPSLSRFRAATSIALGIGVPLILIVSLASFARQQGWMMSPDAWTRIAVWVAIVDAYFTLFLLLGHWIQRRTQSMKRALWIVLTAFAAVLLIEGTRPLLMRVDGSVFPAVPGVPTEVRLSLFRPSGEPQVPEERVEIVEEYLTAVDAYSQQVHAIVARRYALERWWNAVSPQLLLREIASQLLQSEYANAIDVIYSSDRRMPSLATSVNAVWPEAAWLLALCGLLVVSSLVAGRRTGGIEE